MIQNLKIEMKTTMKVIQMKVNQNKLTSELNIGG